MRFLPFWPFFFLLPVCFLSMAGRVRMDVHVLQTPEAVDAFGRLRSKYGNGFTL